MKRTVLNRALIALMFLISCLQAFGRPGDVLHLDFPAGTNENAAITALLSKPDGSILAGGTNGLFSYSYQNMHLLAGTASPVQDMALQTDGKIIVAQVTSQADSGHSSITRYNPDGMIDASFGISGTSSLDFVINSVALQPDGKILATGYQLTTFSNTLSYCLYCTPSVQLDRLNQDGTLDTNLANTGEIVVPFSQLDTPDPGVNHYGQRVLVQPDGKLMVVIAWDTGIACFGECQYAFAVLRYNSNGTLDTDYGNFNSNFGRIGFVKYWGRDAGDGYEMSAKPQILGEIDNYCISTVNCAVLQPDGKLVLGGWFDNNHNKLAMLVRLNLDGSLDNGFGNIGNGLLTADINATSDDASINALTLQPDGKIIAAGYADNSHNKNFLLMRVNTNGTLDDGFGGYDTTPVLGVSYHLNGVVVTNFVDTQDDSSANAVLVDGLGNILSGGFAQTRPVSDLHQYMAFAYYQGNPEPLLQVQEPAGTVQSGISNVDFGLTLLGGGHSKDFTVLNSGNSTLHVGLNIIPPDGGGDASSFSVDTGGYNPNSISLSAGQSASFKVWFNPTQQGTFNAKLHVTNDGINGPYLDIPLTGTGTPLSLALNNPMTGGFDTEGLSCFGLGANFTLGYAPVIGTQFTVVTNTSSDPIFGIYTNMPDHAPVVLAFNNTNYGFMVNYEGGNGNDIVLTCVGATPDLQPTPVMTLQNFYNTSGFLDLFGTANDIAGGIYLSGNSWAQTAPTIWARKEMNLSNGFICRFEFIPGSYDGYNDISAFSFDIQNGRNSTSIPNTSGDPFNMALYVSGSPGYYQASFQIEGTALPAAGQPIQLQVPMPDSYNNSDKHEVILSYDGSRLNILLDGSQVLADTPLNLRAQLTLDGYGLPGFRSEAFDNSIPTENGSLTSWQMYLCNPGSRPVFPTVEPASTLAGSQMIISTRDTAGNVVGNQQMITSFIVDPSVEIRSNSLFTNFDVDVGNDTIRIFNFRNNGGVSGPGQINPTSDSLVFQFYPYNINTPFITGVFIDVSNNVAAFSDNSTRVQFIGDTIWLNLNGLSLNSSNVIALKVQTIPVNNRLVLNPSNGHYYSFFQASGSWADANLNAGQYYYNFPAGYHARLAAIHSQQEQDFISQQFAPLLGPGGRSGVTWLGGQMDSNRVFQWTDGKPFNYTNWAAASPANISATNNCIALLSDGTWSNFNGSLPGVGTGFLIESAPIPEPILITPASSSVAGNILPVSFSLFDNYGAPGTAKLSFMKSGVTNDYLLAPWFLQEGTFGFDMNIQNPFGQSFANILSGATLGAGIYSVVYSYMDIYGNRHSSAISTNVEIDLPQNIVSDGGFESVNAPSGKFAYSPSSSAWSFQGKSGVFIPPVGATGVTALQGSVSAFLQAGPQTNGALASFSQTITLGASGTYLLSYYVQADYLGDQFAYQILLDGLPLATNLIAINPSYAQKNSLLFHASAGQHTLTFGVDPSQPSNNAMAYFDAISVNLPGDSGLHSYPDGTRLRIVVTRDPSQTGTTLIVEGAYSLQGPWTALATSALGTPFAGPGYVSGEDGQYGLQTVVIRDTVIVSDAPSRFLRLRAQ